MSMLLALLAAGSGLQTAEDAMAASRRLTVPPEACPAAVEARGDAVIVCGRRDADRRHRMPYPSLRDRSDLRLPGETRPIDLAATPGSCGTVGMGYGCTGGLDLIGLALSVAMLGAKLIEGAEPLAPPVPKPED